jgi:hypothetical protein
VNAGASCPICASYDDIVRNEGIAVKEVLARVRADLRFPAYSSRSQFKRPENAVAGADEYQIAYDRRGVRKSAASLEMP